MVERAIESYRDRLRANLAALANLLLLAEGLRRANSDKWVSTLAEWQRAVREISLSPVPHLDDPAKLNQAILAAQSAGRRLGNSGEARFGSASVGRQPDSSLDGQRFLDDLRRAQQCFAELQAIQQAEPGDASDYTVT